MKFNLFEDYPKLQYGITLRKTGDHHDFSEGNPNLQKRLNALSQSLATPYFARTQQIHGTLTLTVESPLASHQIIGEADVLMTSQMQTGLLIRHADCQSAIIYDPKQHVLALIHAGWKGNVQNIYAHAIEEMQRQFKSQPQNLLVGIGPSLGPSHSEFIHYKQEFPKQLWKYQRDPYYFDLWQLAKDQLIESGVLKSHIEMIEECTYTNPDRYYSYRRNHTKKRHATFAWLE